MESNPALRTPKPALPFSVNLINWRRGQGLQQSGRMVDGMKSIEYHMSPIPIV